MPEIKEIYWLAGLLDGEGCFYFHHSPTIALQMSDEDLVVRAALLFGCQVKITDMSVYKATYKQSYRVYAYGANAIGWMMTIFSVMGVRRQEKIREVILEWLSRPRGRGKRGGLFQLK